MQIGMTKKKSERKVVKKQEHNKKLLKRIIFGYKRNGNM